jgi:very-short-patch-repair endonuclease
LKNAVVEASPVELPRSAHLERLKRLCDSNLEKEFLAFLEEHALILPTHAQRYYEEFKTRPDFTYAGDNPTFIYVDGPPHDYPHRQQRDEEQTAYLRSLGILVVRFHHKADWGKIIRQHPSTFGVMP